MGWAALVTRQAGGRAGTRDQVSTPEHAHHSDHPGPHACWLPSQPLTSEVCFCHSSLRMGAESSAERMAR